MLSSWSSEEDCCKWIGVQCHNSTRIVNILNLRMDKFDGPIPNILSNLQNLKSLLLAINNLSGTIPEWFGRYKHLQELDLSANSFYGSIPPIWEIYLP
ncbi:hypothetical protein L6164_036980 [Bauhinia variegata]|uniref:Uncharacterized protein n=1 Tax=Bauhinia variegata TaxID=167791 RepID=A0ACB9KJH1_BAUVA|nr:hypothetical protein L6164_036980 [Bauhinia variegata]